VEPYWRRCRHRHRWQLHCSGQDTAGLFVVPHTEYHQVPYVPHVSSILTDDSEGLCNRQNSHAVNGPFRHISKFSCFDMEAKREPNFFMWYLCRFWRYNSDFYISAKDENRHIMRFHLIYIYFLFLKCAKVIVIRRFFRFFCCNTWSLQSPATGVCHAHLYGIHVDWSSLSSEAW